MTDFHNDGPRAIPEIAARRGLFTRLAAATALGLAGLVPALSGERAVAATNDGPDWPGRLKGRHRQVVDAIEINDGFPLAFVYTFLITNPAPGSATGVIVVRHISLTLALNNAMWEKYKIGPSLKITDPETKAPAMKNPYLHPKPGVLLADDYAIDKLLAKGVVFGACNIALHALSKKLAGNAGVSADDAAKEWTANVIPGITIIPSGTWGVNRAQEAGCTYCAGG
jgi:intracellular sulfur oxidation DsrE/DsrF family protein